jgi:DNA-binding MurR/RpiR family transcriptional regulator
MSKQSAKKKSSALVPEVVEPVLSRRHEAVIVALLANPKITDAAKAAGVSESTVWRLMQNEVFQKRYREAQSEALTTALGSIQGAATEAVATLREIATSGKNETARTQAAKAVLDYTFKVRELFDLEDRVKRLETKLKDRNAGA